MFLVDTNVLVYAVNRDDENHRASSAWLDHAMASGEAVGLPWIAVAGFLRVVTNPRALPTPLTPEQATDQVRAWLAPANGVTPEPTARHLDLLAGLLRETGTAGDLVNDAHIAALALEYGATIVSYDTDFALFGVDWLRPPAA